MGGEGRRTGRKKVVHESEETRLTDCLNRPNHRNVDAI